MSCDSSLLPSTEINRSKVLNENKQLSFMYQPGVGLYDKKTTEPVREILSDKNHQIKLFDLDISTK